METKVIATPKAPSAIGPYVQGIQAGDFIFFSGQIGIDPAVGKLVEGCVKCQAKQALKNIAALLEEVGATTANVVKSTVFLVDMADFAAFNEVYAKYFTGKPARSCCAVKTLPKNVLCEIEAIAEL